MMTSLPGNLCSFRDYCHAVMCSHCFSECNRERVYSEGDSDMGVTEWAFSSALLVLSMCSTISPALESTISQSQYIPTGCLCSSHT